MKTPILLINFKTYEQSTGAAALKLAKICESVAKKSGVNIAVAPQLADLREISGAVKIPIFAQHFDAITFGSNTGFVLPESVKAAGAVGSLINHSEHRIGMENIAWGVDKMRELKMLSVVCVKDIQEAKSVAKLAPDFIAYEPPELIGSGVSVSQTKPEVVEGVVEEVARITNRSVVLCGAGITNGGDVKSAIRLGTRGVLVASGVVKAKDPKAVLEDFARNAGK